MNCEIKRKLEEVIDLLTFPDTDDPHWIVTQLNDILGIEKGVATGEELKCPAEDPETNRVLEAIDSAKISILRGIHSGDKVAKLLINLVEAIWEREKEDPHCMIKDTEEFHDADAYVLRIKRLKK